MTTSSIAFAKLCQRVGNITFLKMEVVAWDQSTHLLFVQLQTAFFFFFFKAVLRTRQKGPRQYLKSRCDGRSKNKQIGNRKHETEAGPTECMREWWHQTTHNPTKQVQPHSVSVLLLRHMLIFLHFILSVSLCQTGPKACSIPQCSYMEYKPQVMLVFSSHEKLC